MEMEYRPSVLSIALVAAGALLGAGSAKADNDNATGTLNNQRLNNGVIANVYTVQHRSGCSDDLRLNFSLQRAAERHTRDMMDNHSIDGDIGSDGSTPQDRANGAGYQGQVTETLLIQPSMAINANELMYNWYKNPAYLQIMSDCQYTEMGVWSLNSWGRSVLVAVYGRPDVPIHHPRENIPLDLAPDYDAADELEFGVDWWASILRGVYPPPPNGAR
jgi:uncharacterized protein YkwD